MRILLEKGIPNTCCRGIDFKGVRTVLNVEPPSSVAGYVHRVGRTGRAGQAGCAVSLLDPTADAALLAELQAQLPGMQWAASSPCSNSRCSWAGAAGRGHRVRSRCVRESCSCRLSR